MNNLNVKHDPSNHMFYVNLNHGQAILDYERHGDLYLDYKSTHVPKEYRHRQVGTALVEHALDFAKINALKVKASCPFVNNVMISEPEYHSLRYHVI